MQTKYLKTLAFGLATMMALNSCQEQIDEGARFTFVGNTVASYLQSVPECSHFVDILTRGECIGLMKAYGQYTCFAPTNESVESFLLEQYTKYKESYDKHLLDPEKNKITDTGVYSPYLSELSTEKCREIARNHILPRSYYGTDFIGSTSIPDANMNDRDLELNIVNEGGEAATYINNTARIKSEEEVENGVVHIVEGVVNPSSLDVPSQLNEYSYFSLFCEALNKTGYADSLTKVMDNTYTEGDKIVQSIRDKEMAPYPKNRRFGFTVFLESNKTFADAGIHTFDDLVAECQKRYPESMDVWSCDGDMVGKVNHSAPLTDWRNPVNQFIGYHILDRRVKYDELVCHNISVKGTDVFKSEEDFPSNADRTEYYVTMNNRILKVTMPLSNTRVPEETILLNYALEGGQDIKVYSREEFKRLDKENYSGFITNPSNGEFNVIEKVLFYDEDVMTRSVLNCIIRIDAAALFSELTNNKIRWNYASTLTADGSVFIPHYYCKRVKVYADDTRLFYLAPHTSWFNYQGDEMMALGLFDFAYRLPPLPAGTYEIRMGYSASSARHVVQVYLDNEVTGLPIDLRLLANNPKIGSIPDDQTSDEGVTNDKDMKNRGYLKGPTTFFDDKQKLARHNNTCLRAVIATKYLSAGAHWLRFKNVNESDNGTAQFMHDYFEIVPMSFLRDESVSIEDRRK